MSGISLSTVLEINNHPDDLEIVIGRECDGGKYAFTVSRGPGHRYKLLISTKPFAETIEHAVAEVKNLLNAVHLYATKELQNKDSFVTKIINPSGDVDLSQTLNPDLIERIVDSLQKIQTASTYKMLVNQSK